ncbi:MAG: hypothetical protein UX45_C0034G0007 [Candidatus Uhrbacteria bacterium GW2011_GWF2_46_218]|uniref:Uncharacterized protein n=1 Tax=Candidatus Uhrbacteria bacterium GW2011_GWF2_46_218 TaxID=1619001 RepID=A0A0G1PDE4_9BACT|nr:MAG: hypothetical protein UX45_C0034G0007 [Candidatus Uhrbacteria bacterium GW2011_GWF2_46_218]
MKDFVNPLYNRGTIWKSYRLINKGRWHISWNSLLRYDNLKFSTPKPWLWFLRFYNPKNCLWCTLLGFTFIWYKRTT